MSTAAPPSAAHQGAPERACAATSAPATDAAPRPRPPGGPGPARARRSPAAAPPSSAAAAIPTRPAAAGPGAPLQAPEAPRRFVKKSSGPGGVAGRELRAGMGDSRGVGVAKEALGGLAGDPDPGRLRAALAAAARADPGGPAERLLALLAGRAPGRGPPGPSGAGGGSAGAGGGEGAGAGAARGDGADFLPQMVRHIMSEKPAEVPGLRPPPSATHCYKVLARVGPTYRSVYDGLTEYRPGITLFQKAEPRHGGGLYVFGSVGSCFRPDRHMFPGDAELSRYPKAIARCWAWNAPGVDGRAGPPIQYGPKMAFDFLHVAEIIEHPRERARNSRALDELELDNICSMEALPEGEAGAGHSHSRGRR